MIDVHSTTQNTPPAKNGVLVDAQSLQTPKIKKPIQSDCPVIQETPSKVAKADLPKWTRSEDLREPDLVDAPSVLTPILPETEMMPCDPQVSKNTEPTETSRGLVETIAETHNDSIIGSENDADPLTDPTPQKPTSPKPSLIAQKTCMKVQTEDGEIVVIDDDSDDDWIVSTKKPDP